MTASIQSNRWAVGPNDFSVRVIVPDLKSFFENLPIIGSLPRARVLIIEPGTKALVIDDGLLVGQFDAGTYTLEGFLERLQFWRHKQATIFLTRLEDVPIEYSAQGIPCADNVCFDLKCRWTVQIADILPFMKNLMGARNQLSLQELANSVAPIVNQGIYSALGVSTYDQVRRTDFTAQLRQDIKSQVDVKLCRYGLTFVDIQILAMTSEADNIADRQGDLFQRSREQQLDYAAKQLDNEELSLRLGDLRTKSNLRDQLRRVIADDNFNKTSSQNDFDAKILEIDKEKLLRAEERESLIACFEARKEDRDGQRLHLLATLDLQREQELDELRIQMDHIMRQKGLAQEIELANISRGEEAEQWRHELLHEQERLAHRLAQRQSMVRAKWDRIRDARQLSRSDAWEAILHDQKMEEIRADLDVAKAERTRKVAIIQAELNARLAAEKLEIQKRQQDWELENREKRSENQLNRLRRIQEMNAQFAERQMRIQVEIENLKQDSASKRELDRIQAMSTVSSDVLIATASTGNAALLADLKKSEAGRLDPSKHEEERLRLYEKLNETERAKADAIAEAYKTAMQAQQSSVQQMIGGLAQASGASGVVPYVQPCGPMVPPPVPAAVTWYAAINGAQSPPMQWAQLLQCIQMGQVNASTMVWRAGMPSWLLAGQVPELVPYVGALAGPQMTTTSPGSLGPPPM